MRLYFFRHGEAEDGMDKDDYDRVLTERGAARVKTAAKGLRKLGIKPAKLYSSPRIRARQTADILSDVLGVPVDERPEVDYPQFDVEKVARLIADLPQDSDVFFVGHEPTFSEAVNALTQGLIEMKKGGVARVDITGRDPLRGLLVWLIAPKVFDVLGE